MLDLAPTVWKKKELANDRLSTSSDPTYFFRTEQTKHCRPGTHCRTCPPRPKALSSTLMEFYSMTDDQRFQSCITTSDLVAYSSSYYEKAIITLQRACLKVAGHLSTTPRWGNSACVFPDGTTSKLAACSPHCPFNAERQAGKLWT